MSMLTNSLRLSLVFASACGSVTPPPPTALAATKAADASAAADAQAEASSRGFVDVCVGGNHSCAVNEAGAVYCWGANDDGQVGAAGVARAFAPVLVRGLLEATKVRCGVASTCALSRTGEVSCWGDVNGAKDDAPKITKVPSPGTAADMVIGRLGVYTLSTKGDVSFFTRTGMDTFATQQVAGVDDATRFVAADQGSDERCVMRRTGPPSCFAAVPAAAKSPPKGGGSFPRRPTPPDPNAPQMAVPRAEFAGAKDVIAWGGSCAIFPDGHLTCREPWARELLEKTTGGAPLAGFEAAGGHVACVRLATGEVRCATNDTSMPIVGQGAAGLAGARAMAISSGHGCAVVAGDVVCWGEGSRGQLGDGTRYDHPKPVRVPGIDDAVRLAVAEDFTCVVRRSGRLTCWGEQARCAMGSLCDPSSFAPTDVAMPDPIEDVALGSHLSTMRLCAKSVKTGWQCRFGDWVRVPALKPPLRELHSGVLVSEDNRAWSYAPLNPPERPTPHYFDIVGARVRNVAPDGYCAVDTTGHILCGHCGVCGAAEGRRSLTKVPHTRLMAEVSSLLNDRTRGDTIVCGRTEDGGVECWREGGVPWDGRAKGEPYNLENLAQLKDVVQLDAKGARYEPNVACVLTKAGVVQCWGDNERGQLGDGTTTNRMTVAPVKDLPPAKQIGIASHHACALTAQGAVYCWGSNEHGAVANGAPGMRSNRTRIALP